MRGTAVLVTTETIEAVFSKVVQAINSRGSFRENPLDASRFIQQPRELCARTGLVCYPFVRSSWENNEVAKIVLVFSQPDDRGDYRLSRFTREYADGIKVIVPVRKSPRYRLP